MTCQAKLEAERRAKTGDAQGDLTEQIEWLTQNPDTLIEFEFVAPMFEFGARSKIQGESAVV